jgi:WD40 repeat protein
VGNDKSLRIGDLRNPHRATGAIADLHRLAVNSVAWNPVRSHTLITSSFDGTMALCDLRVLDKPCTRMVFNDKGRESQGGIMKPVWSHFGERIVTLDCDKRGFGVWSRNGDNLFSCEAPFGLKVSQMTSDCDERLWEVCVDGSLVLMQTASAEVDDSSRE